MSAGPAPSEWARVATCHRPTPRGSLPRSQPCRLLAVDLGKRLGAFLSFPICEMRTATVHLPGLPGLLKGHGEGYSSPCTWLELERTLGSTSATFWPSDQDHDRGRWARTLWAHDS